MLRDEGERKRAMKPKVRTGCVTCKRRRVKCDEGKPACQKCIRLGLACEGYRSHTAKQTGSASRCLVPIAARWDPTMALMPLAVGSTAEARFNSQLDWEYFQSFQHKAVTVLAGPFKDQVWTRVALQACHEEPAIRSLVLSIGALEMFHKSSTEPQTHRLYALEHYGQALYSLRKPTKSLGSVRTLLIAAVLIFYFENLNSGKDTATTHFLAALHCLRKELLRHTRKYRHNRTLSPTPDLEGELIAAFVRLDCGILLHLDTWAISDAHQYILDCDFSEWDIPAAFSRLDEARACLEQIKFNTLPGITEVWASSMRNPGKPVVVDDARLEQVKLFAHTINRWLIAYRPLYQQALASRAAGGPFIAEFVLQLQALSGAVAAQSLCSANGDDDDNSEFVEAAETLVMLARVIATDPGFYRGFVCECSLVPGLFILMLVGPNIQLRREALELMKSIVPRRENVWDSASLVKLGELSLSSADTVTVA